MRSAHGEDRQHATIVGCGIDGIDFSWSCHWFIKVGRGLPLTGLLLFPYSWEILDLLISFDGKCIRSQVFAFKKIQWWVSCNEKDHKVLIPSAMEIPFGGGKILEEIWIISEVLMMWEVIRQDDWCLIRSLVDPLGSQQRMFASLWDHNRGVVEVYSYDAAKLQTNDDRTWVLKTWSIVRQS